MSKGRKKKKQKGENDLTTGLSGGPTEVYIRAKTTRIKPEEQLSPLEAQEIIQARIREQDEVILPQRRKEGTVTREWRVYGERRRV